MSTIVGHGSIRSLDPSGKGHLTAQVARESPNHALTSRLSKVEKELVDQVAYDLSYPDIKRSSCVTCVAHLVDLGQAQLASQKFLAARRELLQQRSRMISYLGDVPAYISELGVVMFTILKHTADWYLTAFRENRMISSGCFLSTSISFTGHADKSLE